MEELEKESLDIELKDIAAALSSGSINWNDIRTLDDIKKLPKEIIYDDSIDKGNDYKIRSDIVDEEEIEDALFWKDYARGVMLVSGAAGQGKDMTAHMIAYKLHRYFGLTVVSDTPPRSLFGDYVPFSEAFLADQLDRMYEVATHTVPHEKYINNMANKLKSFGYKPKEALEKAMLEEEKYTETPRVDEKTGKWISSRGEVFIRNAVWLLSEFGAKYMNIEQPHSPITKTILYNIFPIWRHLNCVIIGNTQEVKDINRRCEPKITAEIRCTRMLYKPDPSRLLFQANLRSLKYISSMGELEYSGNKVPLRVDGSKIREFLGRELVYEGDDRNMADEYAHQMNVEKYGIPIIESSVDGAEETPVFKVWRYYGWKDIYNTKQAIAIQALKGLRRNQ